MAGKGPRRRRRLIVFTLVAIATALGVAAVLGLLQARSVRDDLLQAKRILAGVERKLKDGQTASARPDIASAHDLTSRAANTVDGPLWSLAAHLPVVGDDISTSRQVTHIVDRLAGTPLPALVDAAELLDPSTLAPRDGRIPLAPLRRVAQPLGTAGAELRAARDELDAIDTSDSLSQVADAVTELRGLVDSVIPTVTAADQVARLAPPMLGSAGPRTYLLLVQNNAEARASGGIPGALAVLRFTQGKIELVDQATAQSIGKFSAPVLPLGAAAAVHSDRLGRFMQDVNFTPDFPTTAQLAREMWRRYTLARGQAVTVDGVISIDPVALSYLLKALGPVDASVAGQQVRLTADNAVQYLLSDIYAEVKSPAVQDAIFARLAAGVFAKMTTSHPNPKVLLQALGTATDERRLLLWSSHPDEQSIIAATPLRGALPTGEAAGGSFGVFFNDGTGSKMSYYLRSAITLVPACDGSGTARLSIDLTSTAPKDAATSLDPYVTGGNSYGVPAGEIATVILVYLPPGAKADWAMLDGKPTGIARHDELGRPMVALGVRNVPQQRHLLTVEVSGLTTTSEFTVDHTPMAFPLPVTTGSC